MCEQGQKNHRTGCSLLIIGDFFNVILPAIGAVGAGVGFPSASFFSRQLPNRSIYSTHNFIPYKFVN